MMKRRVCNLWMPVALSCWLLAGPTSCAGVGSPPEEQRERAERLEEQARDLKAAGKHDEAQRAMQEARELRAQAGSQPAGMPLEERARLDRERDELVQRLQALRAAGEEDQAAEVKERILELERALQSRPGFEPRPEMREGRPMREEPDAPRPRDERERRMHHLQVAIDNLHAAGLHEPAERLTRELERDQARARGGRESGPAPEIARLMEETERLRAELREMHRNLRELGERMEELSRRGR